MIWKTHGNEIVAGTIGGFSWLLAQATTALPPVFDKLVENGILAVLVAFLVWNSWQREQRQSARIDQLENRHPELLERTVVCVDKSTDACEKLTCAVDRMDKTLKELIGNK